MTSNWKESLLTKEKSVRDAAKLLTTTSMRIVMIVDETGRLLGTVTDGDIRRALIQKKDMNSSLIEIMQHDPVTVEEGTDRRKAIGIMRDRDLLHLPVLDKIGRVVDLELMQNFVFNRSRDNTVLLMAGGFGKRLRPLTQEVPKPLLTVGGKPILEIILENLIDTGFSNFYLAVHYKSDQVRNHFGSGDEWGVSINYIEEEKPLGTAGALGHLQTDKKSSPLLVMNSDLLTRLDFGQLLDYHQDYGGMATMCVRESEYQIPYGIVESDGIRIVDIKEKPVQKFLVNAGIYVLEQEFVARCKFNEVKDMPDLVREVIMEGGKINMFPIHEYWIDIGRVEDYEQAQMEGVNLIA